MVQRIIAAFLLTGLAACNAGDSGAPPQPTRLSTTEGIDQSSATRPAGDGDADAEVPGSEDVEPTAKAVGKTGTGRPITLAALSGTWVSPCIAATPAAGQLVSQYTLTIKGKTATLAKSLYRKMTCDDGVEGDATGDFYFTMTTPYELELTGASTVAVNAQDIHLVGEGYSELLFNDKTNADRASLTKFCGITTFSVGVTARSTDRTNPLCMGPQDLYNVWKLDGDKLYQGSLSAGGKNGQKESLRPVSLGNAKPWHRRD